MYKSLGAQKDCPNLSIANPPTQIDTSPFTLTITKGQPLGYSSACVKEPSRFTAKQPGNLRWDASEGGFSRQQLSGGLGKEDPCTPHMYQRRRGDVLCMKCCAKTPARPMLGERRRCWRLGLECTGKQWRETTPRMELLCMPITPSIQLIGWGQKW